MSIHGMTAASFMLDSGKNIRLNPFSLAHNTAGNTPGILRSFPFRASSHKNILSSI